MRRFAPIFLCASVALAAVPNLAELNRMIARFAPAELKADPSKLAPGDQQALQKLIDAARVLDGLFLTQRWSGNAALQANLQKDTSALGKARLHYFVLNKGPWSDLDDQTAFLPGVPPKKLPGANFYPEDMTKDEFESWVKTLPAAQQEQARGFFTVIRRGADKKLAMVAVQQSLRAGSDACGEAAGRSRRGDAQRYAQGVPAAASQGVPRPTTITRAMSPG